MSTHLPLEIELEIVKRLPVKSLLRFISVCKAWKSMIECSQFVAGYRVLPTQPQQHLMITYDVLDRQEFVCFVDDDSFPQQKFVPTLPPLLQLLRGSRIVDNSCGLLYLDGWFREPGGSRTSMVVLWNPSIRRSIAVALPTPVLPPFESLVGFGVCPHTNDPKLVQITYIYDDNKIESISCIPFQVMVFTLSSGEWRCVRSNRLPRKSIAFDHRFSIVIGQFIYWLANDRTVEDHRNHHNLIMSFDLISEEFIEVDLPDSLTHVKAIPRLLLSRLKESLVVVDYAVYYLPWKRPCVVWMMKHGDPKSFTKLFAIEASHAPTLKILGFIKGGQLIYELFKVDRQDNNTSCELVVYEPCSGNIEPLGVRGNTGYFFGSSYTESLLLLDHDDGRIIRCGDVKTAGTGQSCFI